jgi:hypothetical protein
VAAAPAPVAGASSPQGATKAKVPVDPLAAWEHLVGMLGERSITLSAVYVHARLLAWDERGLELGFARETLQASLGADTDNVTRLKAFLADELGGSVELRITVKDLPPLAIAASGSVAERDGERLRAQRAEREDEARAHPLTRAAVATFDAVIKEIKEI